MLGDEACIAAAFSEARDAEYREGLGRCADFHAELAKERAAKFTFAELEQNEEDLAKLVAWRDKIRARDQLGASLRMEAERALDACRADLEEFEVSVYAAVDHGSSTRDGE